MITLARNCTLLEEGKFKQVKLSTGKVLFINTNNDVSNKNKALPTIEAVGLSVKIDLEFLDKLIDYSNFPYSYFTLVGDECSISLTQKECIELLEEIKKYI